MRRTLLGLLVVLVGVFLPSLVLACPTCINAVEESRMAFLITTGLLSFLPLIMMGSFFLWLRARAREIAREEAEALLVVLDASKQAVP